VDFTYKLFDFVEGGAFKAKTSQVSDMFPQRAPKFLTYAPKSSQVSDLFLKEFPIATQIYPIFLGKCCPPFTYITGPKG
jgi:hypothetical protein